MATLKKVTTGAGLVAPAVALVLLLASTVLSQDFSWQSTSLSFMGSPTRSPGSSTVFNAGLIVGGLLGTPFVLRLWGDAENLADRVGAVVFGVSLLAMAGIGFAPLDTPTGERYHFLFAVLFFFGATVAMWIIGSGRALRGEGAFGVGTIWVSNVHVVAWIVWIVLEAMVWTGDGDTWTYFAVPEMLGAVLFGGWVVVQAARLF